MIVRLVAPDLQDRTQTMPIDGIETFDKIQCEVCQRFSIAQGATKGKISYFDSSHKQTVHVFQSPRLLNDVSC
jgi:hypothetical protein